MSGNRKVYVLRHAERVDFLFGKWFRQASKDGKYERWNMNMPKSIPARPKWEDWENDTPITNIGHTQARLVGEMMKEKGVQIDAVYCSPAFRCVQTATSALEALGCNASLRIEPGLFEWLGFLHRGLPNYFTPEELSEQGFNIDVTYTPKMTLTDLGAYQNETLVEQADRNSRTVKTILTETKGNILIVAHAISLDTCTRQIIGKPQRKEHELMVVMDEVEYCGMVMMENGPGDKWNLKEPPTLPLSSSGTRSFNWRKLL